VIPRVARWFSGFLLNVTAAHGNRFNAAAVLSQLVIERPRIRGVSLYLGRRRPKSLLASADRR
jgi:hypothetical protein